MQTKYYFDKKAWLYIVTNTVNGMMYIGQTTSPRKDYLGSGKYISAAIKKYGKKNFIRVNLHYDWWEVIDLLETMYIEKYDAINSHMFYNLKEGGHHGKHNNTETSKKMSDARLGKTYEEIFGAEEAIRQKEIRRDKLSGKNNPFFGQSHTETIIQLIKEKRALQVITSESNKKRSVSMMNKPRFTCSVCGKSVPKSNLIQFHEKNCGKEYKESTKEKQRESMNALPKFECYVCGKFFFKRNLVQHHGDKCRGNKK
jgi:group I intron endonuclease